MNEQENDREEGTTAVTRDLPVLGASKGCSGAGSSRRRGDLVVDLSGIKTLDLASLALLLTAQRQAQKENRTVWLAGVPAQIWQALDAMGLGELFRAFPVSAGASI